MKMMNKIIEFSKKNYKVLIPIMVVFVLSLSLYFIYMEYRFDSYKTVKEESVYQYFTDEKVEYTALVTYNIKDTIVDVSAKDKKIYYDSTPIYYSGEDKIIFPEEMTIVFPLKGASQMKLYKYSVYEKDDKYHKLTVNTESDDYSNFFLYDGADTYFFPDSVTLMINGKKYKELGDMSYISVDGGYTLLYYDRENQVSEFLEIEGDEITVTSEHVNVNLSNDSFWYFNTEVLLFSPNVLNVVSKID